MESVAVPAGEFEVEENGKKISVLDIDTQATYHRDAASEDQEYFVKVKWIKTFAIDHAITEIGLFGNQNSVCKPTTPIWRSTVERLKQRFGIHG